MKPTKQSAGMEAAGSLVPELEGAARSAGHLSRLRPAPSPKTPRRSGTAHGGDRH